MDSKTLLIEAVRAAAGLPESLREHIADATAIEEQRFDRSYIEFLDEQIRLGARGPEWTDRLRQRRAALSPHYGVTLVRGRIQAAHKEFTVEVHPETLAVIHWEEYEMNTDVEPTHDDFWRKYEDAQDDQDKESADAKFAAAERLALQIVSRNPNDAEACYAIALTWYHRWSPQSKGGECVKWLRKTAERDPDHPWVPLYLGYQFFDEKRYNDAFNEFARVDHAYFASIELHWRNLKTRELMICCRVRGDLPVASIGSLKQLVSDYIAADVFDRPVPLELVEALIVPEFRSRFDAEPQIVASEMCRLIEGIGDHDAFPEQLAGYREATQNVP